MSRSSQSERPFFVLRRSDNIKTRTLSVSRRQAVDFSPLRSADAPVSLSVEVTVIVSRGGNVSGGGRTNSTALIIVCTSPVTPSTFLLDVHVQQTLVRPRVSRLQPISQRLVTHCRPFRKHASIISVCSAVKSGRRSTPLKKKKEALSQTIFFICFLYNKFV